MCALAQVMPNMLSRRSFKPPNTRIQLEPGYREAPDVGQPMAIVFIKVSSTQQLRCSHVCREQQRPPPPESCTPHAPETAHTVLRSDGDGYDTDLGGLPGGKAAALHMPCPGHFR